MVALYRSYGLRLALRVPNSPSGGALNGQRDHWTTSFQARLSAVNCVFDDPFVALLGA